MRKAAHLTGALSFALADAALQLRYFGPCPLI
jgi:hypothetical protein